MPLAVHCPNSACGRKLVIAEMPVQPILCPQCNQPIPVVPAYPSPTQTVDLPPALPGARTTNQAAAAPDPNATSDAPARSPIDTSDLSDSAVPSADPHSEALPGPISRFAIRRRPGEGAFGVVLHGRCMATWAASC